MLAFRVFIKSKKRGSVTAIKNQLPVFHFSINTDMARVSGKGFRYFKLVNHFEKSAVFGDNELFHSFKICQK